MPGGASNFESDWRRAYGDTVPTGFSLRAADVRYWLRLHSLPDSKRYADTANERAIVLDRANRLASEMFGEGGVCWLAQSGDVASGWSQQAFQARKAFALAPAGIFTEDGQVWPVFAASVVWRAGAFDELINDRAEDRAAPTIWFQPAGSVFAPYDGGVDLFLPSKADVDLLRLKFSEWLSPHPSGL